MNKFVILFLCIIAIGCNNQNRNKVTYVESTKIAALTSIEMEKLKKDSIIEAERGKAIADIRWDIDINEFKKQANILMQNFVDDSTSKPHIGDFYFKINIKNCIDLYNRVPEQLLHSDNYRDSIYDYDFDTCYFYHNKLLFFCLESEELSLEKGETDWNNPMFVSLDKICSLKYSTPTKEASWLAKRPTLPNDASGFGFNIIKQWNLNQKLITLSHFCYAKRIRKGVLTQEEINQASIHLLDVDKNYKYYAIVRLAITNLELSHFMKEDVIMRRELSNKQKNEILNKVSRKL